MANLLILDGNDAGVLPVLGQWIHIFGRLWAATAARLGEVFFGEFHVSLLLKA
jgi:hypothetical protein